MADLFKCDKCGDVLPQHRKKGRLILQELVNGQPHVAQYNRKAEVCEKCFWQLQTLMNAAAATALPAGEVHMTVIDTVSDVTKR